MNGSNIERDFHPATIGVHADDPLNSTTDVAPPISLTTTFRYTDDPDGLFPSDDTKPPTRDPSVAPGPEEYIYSRALARNTSRLEALLSSLLKGPSLTYSSGLSSFHALIVHLNPKVIAIGEGYHGCHGVLDLYKKLTNCKIVEIDKPESWSGKDPTTGQEWSLAAGDLVHMETPLNPYGTAFDISHYAKLAHDRGALLSVDATFGPPPLQDPFKHGADYIMHSGTKYFGGHSDMLCGVVAIGTHLPDYQKQYWNMFKERIFLGSVMGSLEGWLGVRSIRTLELRVMRQSENATQLARWIHACLSPEPLSDQGSSGPATPKPTDEEKKVLSSALHSIVHASVQDQEPWLKNQMPNGFGPVFSLYLRTADFAKRFPSKLALFHHATSLGGVESLIEWRKMSDPGVDDRLVRVSIGVENIDDLKTDIFEGLKALLEGEQNGHQNGHKGVSSRIKGSGSAQMPP